MPFLWAQRRVLGRGCRSKDARLAYTFCSSLSSSGLSRIGPAALATRKHVTLEMRAQRHDVIVQGGKKSYARSETRYVIIRIALPQHAHGRPTPHASRPSLLAPSLSISRTTDAYWRRCVSASSASGGGVEQWGEAGFAAASGARP